jgi:hypothetical protein
MNPQFPIYIPSKGRAASRRSTMRFFEAADIPYRVIVEAHERASYAAVIDPAKLLVLPQRYIDEFDACMPLEPTQSRGSGPARNFAWQHSIEHDAAWHWVIDDNIFTFYRLNRNAKIRVSDGTIFRCMEDFALRYRNVALAGPNYQWFAKQKQKLPPFVPNTKLYSCILIRNDIPFGWRCRYNEDVDLALRVLKAGWCTIQFNAFLADKATTQSIGGGNTDAFYREEGTGPKATMLAQLHPDVVRVAWKFGRWHHQVDYRPFAHNKLLRKPGLELPAGPDEYGMRIVKVA